MFRNIVYAVVCFITTLFPTFAIAQTYVIGDSIAVGIANANGLDRAGNNVWRRSGRDTRAILQYINRFVASGRAKDSNVILSSGASNSTYERRSGEGRALDVRPIHQQIRLLKAAGATVYLVGTGSRQSPWIRNRYGTYRVNFAAQNVNARLAEVARQEGAIFLGPLERYGRLGDGIHPGTAAARAIYRATQ